MSGQAYREDIEQCARGKMGIPGDFRKIFLRQGDAFINLIRPEQQAWTQGEKLIPQNVSHAAFVETEGRQLQLGFLVAVAE
ncbi:MAG: hypothetical protein NTY41_06405, partial [Proteobacteria bacterium]|nr:hypothetical protein [Pseudomonadota bacterium]